MLKSRLVPMFTCLVWVAALGLSACADLPFHSNVPDALSTPADQVFAFEAMATGVQIYECKKSGDSASEFQWVFKAPEAELYAVSGSRIARHYAGPSWEALDGSKVVGQVKAQYASPDPNAISWLLLSATSNSGKGIFTQTASIQRINTKGGKAPTAGCGQAQLGKVTRVPYTATYNFYNPKS